MPSYYEHNYTAFGDQVLRAEFMENVMRARAVAVMATAQATAPIDEGEYVASFEVSTGIRPTGPKRTPRVFARVTNTAAHALAVEYGYGPVPRYRTLGKAMHAAGGDAKFKP